MGDPAKPLQPNRGMKVVGDRRSHDGQQQPEPAKKTRGRKKGATINKTQEIRRVASDMIKKGIRPRPLEIIKELKKEHIEVSGPQVSTALKGTGMEFRLPRVPLAPSPFEMLPDPATAMSLVSVDDLLLVREFIRRIGTLDKAFAAVIAYRHLGMEGVKREGDA